MTRWVTKKLGDLGYSFSGLSGKTINDFGSGKPFIPYMNIFTNGRINPNRLEYVHIEENEHQNKVEQGDWFFTTSSETPEEVGMTSVLVDDIGEAYLNSFCFGFRLYNKNEFDPAFVSYLFRSDNLRKRISLFAQGSTRYNLPKQQMFEKLYISYPESIEEQCRIASILSSADKAIASSEALIEKYRQIKQGLLTDLLTPKEGWKKETLKNCVSKITDGCHNKPKSVERSSFVMLSSQNIQDNKLDLKDVTYLTEEDFERENIRTNVKAGDVLLTIVGTVGRTYLVKRNDPRFTLQRSVAVLSPNNQLIESEFLLYYLNYSVELIENEAHGCAQKGIYLKQLGDVPISYPTDKIEQKHIASILLTIVR